MGIGDEAPDFQLPLHTGEEFRLSHYRGRNNVVLYFYPRDFTWGCTKEGCLFSSNIREIQNLGGILIGISGDSSETHRRFVREYNLTFPLASDERLGVCRNYRTLWLRGVAIRRITYIIDKQGIIRGKTHHELLIDRHRDYVLRILRDLTEQETIRKYNQRYWNV
jgi:thioredoxin-dependent peroxiredoxin